MSGMAKKKKVRWFAREWRQHRGLKLVPAADRLAEILGSMSPGYLSDLEKGLKRFNQDHLEAMAEAYACEPADIIMRDPTAPDSIYSIWDQIAPLDRPQAQKALEGFKKKTGTG